MIAFDSNNPQNEESKFSDAIGVGHTHNNFYDISYLLFDENVIVAAYAALVKGSSWSPRKMTQCLTCFQFSHRTLFSLPKKAVQPRRQDWPVFASPR